MNKLVVALVLVLATVTAACGSDDRPPASTGSGVPSGPGGSSPGDGGTPSGDAGDAGTTAPVNAITVKSNEFVPASLAIKVGEEVTWTWAGGTHNVVSGVPCTADGVFTSGSPTGTVGNKFTRKFDKAGVFDFFCAPHCSTGMMGTVVVQ